MVKKETIDYKIIGKRNDRNTYGTLYKVKQTRKIRKCIKVHKNFYLPVSTIRKGKTKLLMVWKPLPEMVFNEQPQFLLINKYFNDYFLEFNNIKVLKVIKSKKLLKKLTK